MLFELDTVKLSKLSGSIDDELIASVKPIDMIDYGMDAQVHPVIVAINGDGRVDLLDGYHRIAGLLGHQDTAIDDEITVIVCHSEEIAAVIADKYSNCEAHEAAVALASAMAR